MTGSQGYNGTNSIKYSIEYQSEPDQGFCLRIWGKYTKVQGQKRCFHGHATHCVVHDRNNSKLDINVSVGIWTFGKDERTFWNNNVIFKTGTSH